MEKSKYKKEQKKRRWILTVYSSKWFSFPWNFKCRIKAYRKHFNIGINPIIEHDVWITRTHGFSGSIKIGDNVTLAKHVFIDYSGKVVIGNNVIIAAGVKIESHHNDLDELLKGNNINIQDEIEICDNVFIGVNAVILPPCSYIGENSRVGAGAVFVDDVPANAVVVGVPGKVVKYLKVDENNEKN